MNLRDIVAEQSIQVGVAVSDKAELIDRLLELASKSGRINDISEAKAEVLEREKIMSTGVGGGIALPHAKTNAVKEPTGSLIVLSEGIDFDAIDNEDVHIAFLLLGRENNVGLHLRLLSKISRLISGTDFQTRLKDAQNSNDVVELFSEYDSALTL